MDLVAVDSQVGMRNQDIATAESRRAQVTAALEAEQLNLEEAQRQLEERQRFLEKRLLSSYKSDDIEYLDVILGAGDFSEFLNRVDMINLIADEDRELIESIVDTKASIEEKLSSLAAKQEELAGLIDELSTAQQELITAQAEQQSVLASVQGRIQANDAQMSELQSQAAAIEANMAQIQNQSSPSSGGGYSAPSGGGGGGSFTATAYCLQGNTATGMPVGRGIIAVDPGVIPLGSRVYVSGYGNAIAADTGGSIHGNKIDVWLPCGEAYSWGVRSVDVTVY